MKITSREQFLYYIISQSPVITLTQFIQQFADCADIVSQLSLADEKNIYSTCNLFCRIELILALSYILPINYQMNYDDRLSPLEIRTVHLELKRILNSPNLPISETTYDFTELNPGTTHFYLLWSIEKSPKIPSDIKYLPSWMIFKLRFTEPQLRELLITCQDKEFLERINYSSLLPTYQVALALNPTFRKLRRDLLWRKSVADNILLTWFIDPFCDSLIHSNLIEFPKGPFYMVSKGYPIGRLYRYYLATSYELADKLLLLVDEDTKKSLLHYMTTTFNSAAPHIINPSLLGNSSTKFSTNALISSTLLQYVDASTHEKLRHLSKDHLRSLPKFMDNNNELQRCQLSALQFAYLEELSKFTDKVLNYNKRKSFYLLTIQCSCLLRFRFYDLENFDVSWMLCALVCLGLAYILNPFHIYKNILDGNADYNKLNQPGSEIQDIAIRLFAINELIIAIIKARPQLLHAPFIEFELEPLITKLENTKNHLTTLTTNSHLLTPDNVKFIFSDTHSFLNITFRDMLISSNLNIRSNAGFSPYKKMLALYAKEDLLSFLEPELKPLVKGVYQDVKARFFATSKMAIPKEPPTHLIPDLNLYHYHKGGT